MRPSSSAALPRISGRQAAANVGDGEHTQLQQLSLARARSFASRRATAEQQEQRQARAINDVGEGVLEGATAFGQSILRGFKCAPWFSFYARLMQALCSIVCPNGHSVVLTLFLPHPACLQGPHRQADAGRSFRRRRWRGHRRGQGFDWRRCQPGQVSTPRAPARAPLSHRVLSVLLHALPCAPLPALAAAACWTL